MGELDMMERATVLAIALATVLVPATHLSPDASAGEGAWYETTVPSFDGHQVPVRVYTAQGPGPSDRAPTLLWGPSWAGALNDSVEEGTFFAAHGYNVVAMQFRGFGSTSDTTAARLMQPSHELRDTEAVVDWTAAQPWAATDAPDDPSIGVIGRSYAGGHALLAAALDDRIDAIAPRLAWNDLAQGIAPNGAIQSVWIDLVYWGGKFRGVTLHEDIDRAYVDAMALNRLPAGDGPTGVDIVSWFEAASPASYPNAIDIPTLLIQGVPDVLFNLNEAVANFEQVRVAGGDAYLFTHRAGHILNTADELGALPGSELVPPVGLQPPSDGSPCGDVAALTLAFFDHTLGDAPSFDQARVALATEDGSCIEADAWPPVPATQLELAEAVVVPPTPGEVLVPIALPDGATTIAGVPHLTASWTGGDAADAIVYLSLVVVGPDGTRTLDSQVTPVRGAADAVDPAALARPIDVDLFGVAASLDPGEELFLRVGTTDVQFVHNGQRLPVATMLTDLELALPIAS